MTIVLVGVFVYLLFGVLWAFAYPQVTGAGDVFTFLLLFATLWPVLYLCGGVYVLHVKLKRRRANIRIDAMAASTRIWWHGLVSAAIGSFATAAGGVLTLPAVFNLTHAGLLNMLKLTLVPAALTVFAYLKQSPLPPASSLAASADPFVRLVDEGSYTPAASTAPQPAVTRSNPMSFLAKLLVMIEKGFTGFFSTLLGSDAAKSVEAGIVAFVKTDIGKLAVDAVQAISTIPGLASATARDAAIANLKADLKTAGKDAEAIADSTYNLFIEMAYTYVTGTITSAGTAVATKA
jgi:hypothetical protein